MDNTTALRLARALNKRNAAMGSLIKRGSPSARAAETEAGDALTLQQAEWYVEAQTTIDTIVILHRPVAGESNA